MKKGKYRIALILAAVLTLVGAFGVTAFAKESADKFLTKAPEARSLVYNGAEQELIVPGKVDANNATITYRLWSGDDGYTDAIPSGTNSRDDEDAPAYYVWYKVDPNNTEEYETYKNYVIVPIAKADPSITIEGWNYGEYDPEKNSVVVSPTGYTGKITYKIKAQDGKESSYKTFDPDKDANKLDAGDYTLQAVFEGDKNFNAKKVTANFTVFKADLEDLKLEIDSWTYGDDAATPDLYNNDGDGAVTYKYAKAKIENGEYVKDGDYTSFSNPPKNVGAYILQAKVAASNNYNGATVTCGFEIKKASFSTETEVEGWVYGDYSKKYNTPTVTSNPGEGSVDYYYAVLPEADDHGNYDYESIASWKAWGEEGVKALSAGDYALKAEVNASDNYKEAVAYNNFSISKRTVRVTSVKVNNKTYDGNTDAAVDYEDVVLTYKNEGDGIVSGDEVSIEGIGATFEDANVSYDESGNVAEKKVNLSYGKAGAKLVGKDAANYELAKSKNYTPAEAKINPKEVSLKWYDKKDGTEYTTGNTITYKYNGAEQKPYAEIPAGELIEGDECDVTVEGGQVHNNENSPRVAYNATTELSNKNYAISDETKSYSFNIDRLPVKLTWDPASFTYNGKDQVPEYTITNLAEGDKCTIGVKVSQNGAYVEEYKNVGSYTAVAATVSNNDYRLTGSTGQRFDYSITPANPLPSDGSGDPKVKSGWTYDAESHPLIKAARRKPIADKDKDNVKVEYAVVSGENKETMPADNAWKEDTPAAVDAGTYQVWYRVNYTPTEGEETDNSINPNYTFVKPTHIGQVVVEKKSVNFTWEALDEETVKSEDVIVFTYNGNIRTIKASTTDIFKKDADNVTITESSNTATDVKRNSESESYEVEKYEASVVLEDKNPSTPKAANYEIKSGNKQLFVINPVEVTVTADDKNVSVGAEIPELTSTTTGVPTGCDAVQGISLTTEYVKGSSAGTYPISVNIGIKDNPNYELKMVDGTLTVTGGGGGITPAVDDVQKVVDMLKALDPNSADYAAKAAEAVKAYDALTADQKADKRFTEQTVATKLVDAQEAVKSEEQKAADKKAADEISALINKLPADPVDANYDDALAAYNAYMALTDAQKALLDNATQTKIAEYGYYYGSQYAASQTVKLKSVKAKKGRKAVAKWSKNADVSGYQLYYKAKGTKAKKVTISKASTVKKTVKKLKAGKKYSFKVRTYTKVYNPAEGVYERVYGQWSNVKKAKAKK